MNSTCKVRKIALVGDHLARKCGIATFTSDLLADHATGFATVPLAEVLAAMEQEAPLPA